MKFIKILFKHRLLLWLILPVLLLSLGCGSIMSVRALLKTDPPNPITENIIVIERAPPEKHYNKGGPNGSTSANVDELINDFALMALFSKVVYRKDLNNEQRGNKDCSKLPKPEFGMPHDENNIGWLRWRPTTGVERACFNEGGLFYETYVYPTSETGEIQEAVIAIRGTENTNSQFLYDWWANISTALGIEPGEYKNAKKYIPEVISRLNRENKKNGIKIYITGHSLGGGIAQQTAYLSKAEDIEGAYTFDPSPVTNWSRLVVEGEIVNKDPVIKRISHWKEALAYVRNITSRFNISRFGRSDYEFYFQEGEGGSAVSAHEMGLLACHMAVRMNHSGETHHYPESFVKEVISNEAICPLKKGKIHLPE